VPVPSAIALGGRERRQHPPRRGSPRRDPRAQRDAETDARWLDKPQPQSHGIEPGQRPESQSQSFFRRYGSGLPTSLTYIDLSTRGCAPRRPAADMGTIRRDTSAFPSHGFSRAWREFPGRRPVLATLLAKPKPYLPRRGFQGLGRLRRKDNSSRGPRRRLRVLSRYRDEPATYACAHATWGSQVEDLSVPLPGTGILAGLPFALRVTTSRQPTAVALIFWVCVHTSKRACKCIIHAKLTLLTTCDDSSKAGTVFT